MAEPAVSGEAVRGVVGRDGGAGGCRSVSSAGLYGVGPQAGAGGHGAVRGVAEL